MLQLLKIPLLRLFTLLQRDEQGAALVEYGILVGLISVICIASVVILGTQISTAFSSVASVLVANSV